jgi:hypothetical protein
MAYEEFTGELDKEPQGFAEFTGQLDKPEPSLLDKAGDVLNAVRDYAQSFGPKPEYKSVLEGKKLDAPAGMTDDVDVNANRFARDRSKSPDSVMFRKSNAADKAEKLTTLGKKVLKEVHQLYGNLTCLFVSRAIKPNGLIKLKDFIDSPLVTVEDATKKIFQDLFNRLKFSLNGIEKEQYTL